MDEVGAVGTGAPEPGQGERGQGDSGAVSVLPVTVDDLADLLPLLRGYCTFYECDPTDEDLRTMATAFLDEGAGGTQLIARDAAGRALGHATVLWTWDTTLGQPLAVMEDLFVIAPARGRGVGAALIGACRQLAAERGTPVLAWVTAPDNHTAQRLYDRLADRAGTWLAYRLPTGDRAT